MNSYQTTITEAYLSFSLGKELFAIPLTSVSEIVELLPIDRILEVPAYLRGIIKLRGMIVPVIENRFIFGTLAPNSTRPVCILILSVETAEGALNIGVLADAIHDMYQISSDEIRPYFNEENIIRSEFIQGLAANGEQTIKLLDINQVLTPEQVYDLREVAHSLVR